jgi:hypothetical protein
MTSCYAYRIQPVEPGQIYQVREGHFQKAPWQRGLQQIIPQWRCPLLKPRRVGNEAKIHGPWPGRLNPRTGTA